MLVQNKKWSFISLILFLKESETSPHLITVEHVEEFLRMIVPNISSKQQEFYSKHVLSDGYHKDIDGYLMVNADTRGRAIQAIQALCCLSCNC
jgi:hypothetical protein